MGRGEGREGQLSVCRTSWEARLRARQVLGYRCLPRYLLYFDEADGNVFSQ